MLTFRFMTAREGDSARELFQVDRFMFKIRRYQISLRALLLFVLAFGLWLGWRMHKAREQRALVEAIESYGGWVYYDYDFINGQRVPPSQRRNAPAWLRRAFGDELFRQINQVVLVYNDSPAFRANHRNVMALEDLLARIAAESSLKSLDLKRVFVTDEGLGQIGKMTTLEELLIPDGSLVTDAGVAHLALLWNLKDVEITKSRISDSSLILLSGLPRIEHISLQWNHFSDRGLAGLQGRRTLKLLWIGLGNLEFTDAGLRGLEGFQKLEVLGIQGSHVTASGLKQLRGLKKLREVLVSPTKEERRFLQPALPNALVY